MRAYHSKATATNNRAHMSDSVYDELVDRMAVSLDPAERIKIAKQLQIRFVDQAHAVVLPSPMDFHSFSGRIQGRLRTNKETFSRQIGMMFSEVWIEE